MKWRAGNLEGAFPLLLIGSVLVVYAGLLASEQIGSHSTHLPLWGLLGGVGAVIVGAGIYSTFLEPETVPAPDTSADWVTVPRAEWEARSAVRRPSERAEEAPKPVPIWWEGPPTPIDASVSRASAFPSSARANRRPLPTPSPLVQTHPMKPTRVVPRPTARYSYRELTEELSELEALVYGATGSSARTRPTPPSLSPPPARTCMDCERPLTAAASPTPCHSCGRGLCARCTASSKSEDGEVRCVECRARES